MPAFLVDECCPRLIVDELAERGFDVRYAADTDRRADDRGLVAIASNEQRIIVTEDFDFGELLIRDKLKAPGAIVLFLPKATPEQRARRLAAILGAPGLDITGRLTIISQRRVRQRMLAQDQ
ncbi:MAG: DUF5615 family PIN-like protein [Hyphomonadaceae bacterium]|nr:DUF5615 family PIN-like protein [Hyphomonadaceae bacterium]